MTRFRRAGPLAQGVAAVTKNCMETQMYTLDTLISYTGVGRKWVLSGIKGHVFT